MNPHLVASFQSLPDLVLGPLEGRSDEDWHRAPPGKWDTAQIVEHLTIALEWSGRGLEERRERPPAARRRRTPLQLLGYALVLGLGWVPPGTKAPAASTPAGPGDPADVARRFRAGVALFLGLPAGLTDERARGLFLKHPLLGDLSLVEWYRFHVWHCRHHARQIHERLGLVP